MAESKQDRRNIEARWLRDQMTKCGLSNTELHEQLVAAGFEGQLNNIAMWTTARTSIPNEWLGKVVETVNPADATWLAAEKYSERMPFLRPYFRPIKSPLQSKKHEVRSLEDHLDKSRDSRKAPTRIYYVAKRGKHKGAVFALHKNRKGNFQGGISRFKSDAEEFESIQELWERIIADPDFKVRMSPEKNSGPPSLISRESLVIEWDD